VEAPLDFIVTHLPDSTALWRARNLGFLLARVGFGRDPKPSHVELVRRMMLDCSDLTRREAPRVLMGLDLTDDITKIDLPTLVIGGTADLLTPPQESRRMAALIPGARLERVPGAGHMVMLERTEVLDRLLVEFAREVQAPALPRVKAT
jgi:pimeloyl-ACP methyl ester carboxylesterase